MSACAKATQDRSCRERARGVQASVMLAFQNRSGSLGGLCCQGRGCHLLAALGICQTLRLVPTAFLSLQGNQDRRRFMNLFHLGQLTPSLEISFSYMFKWRVRKPGFHPNSATGQLGEGREGGSHQRGSGFYRPCQFPNS